ncbi:MAG TPA: HSP18 transcriptional regulator [Pseudonocardiaceae bacterium]
MASGSAASTSPTEMVRELRSLLDAVHAGSFPEGQSDAAVLVDALATLRDVRAVIAAWEPELVAAARAAGASWTSLAPALGVTSRQAAERRYLRSQASGNDESTKEARVQATRDRRAGERAVIAWARQNSAELRQLAGQIGGLAGLSAAGRRGAARVHVELAGNDTSSLLGPLSAMRSHLADDHPALAARIAEISADADQQRRNAVNSRKSAASGAVDERGQ